MLIRYCRFLFLAILFTVLSGCAGQMEIDRISFPVAMGIDFDEQNNNIKVYAQIPTTVSNPGGQPQVRKTFKILEGKGDTLLDAMADITSKGSHNISWKHITVIIVTNKIAKHGIANELDLLCRSQQIHMNSYLILTDESLKELLESTPKIESSLPAPLSAIRLVSQQSSHTKAITIREFAIAYLSDGMEPIIPKVSIINYEDDEIGTDFPGLGVFKNDLLVGELDEDLTRGAVLIYGKENMSRIKIPEPKNGKHKAFTIRSIKSVPTIIPDLQQDKPVISIKLELEYILAQSALTVEMDTKGTDRLNEMVGEYVLESVKKTLHKTQKELKSDIFGFGERIYRKYPKYWLKNKDHWNDIFPDIAINVEVKAKLKDTGELLDSLEFLHE